MKDDGRGGKVTHPLITALFGSTTLLLLSPDCFIHVRVCARLFSGQGPPVSKHSLMLQTLPTTCLSLSGFFSPSVSCAFGRMYKRHFLTSLQSLTMPRPTAPNKKNKNHPSKCWLTARLPTCRPGNLRGMSSWSGFAAASECRKMHRRSSCPLR